MELLKARGLQQLRYERADSQGFEAREGGTLAGTFGLRGWRESRHELVWRQEAPSDAHRHAEGSGPRARQSRRENLDAAMEFTEKGLHILVNKGDGQVAVQHRYSKIEHAIPTQIRLKDQSGAIIPVEYLKFDNNMSDARCEVCSGTCHGRIPMQALGTFRYPRMLRDGLYANPLACPPGSCSSARSQESASASASKPSGAKSASSTVVPCTPSPCCPFCSAVLLADDHE